MHYCGVQHANLVHVLAPLLDVGCAFNVVVRVHINNRELGLIHLRYGDIVNHRRIEILQQNLVHRVSRFARRLRIASCQYNGGGE